MGLICGNLLLCFCRDGSMIVSSLGRFHSEDIQNRVSGEVTRRPTQTDSDKHYQNFSEMDSLLINS